jgi:hypothetical protein
MKMLFTYVFNFQKNMLKKAANAAFTFLVANPNHESMKKNFEFYINLPEVDKNDITNLEAPVISCTSLYTANIYLIYYFSINFYFKLYVFQKYVSLYVNGVEAYNKEDFPSAINYFEESLDDYLENEEQCRTYCEGPFDQGWNPDFTPSIASN